MTAGTVRVSPAWLALREPADARARSVDLVERFARSLPPDRPVVIHDLGCGTGSMARWLAPRLSAPQQWVLYDRDPGLLELATGSIPGTGPGGERIFAECRERDITRLDDDQLAGASLITASALLDMLTADELDRVVAACLRAGCPVLLTLSVIGRVDITPADPLDQMFADAFDAHQRRGTARGRLLGPDAVDVASATFARCGAEVLVRPSPWRLDSSRAALLAEWFGGWVRAACEQQPELTAPAAGYSERRHADAAAGRLRATVHHHDLLVRPVAGGPWVAGPSVDGDRTAR